MKIKKQKIMRNKVKTLSIAFALAFTINSCGSDDDSPSEKNTPPVAKVAITGEATVGQTLTADTKGSSDADEQEIKFKYQWYRSDDNKYDDKDKVIDKETKSTYKISDDDKDKYIIVKVIPNDGIEDGEAVTAVSKKISSVELMELEGTQTKDLKLTADITYMVNEPLKMATGTTLTIEAGTTIKFKPGDNFIAILQGAKINAVGTAEKPIIFTCNTKEAGAWGGLFIAGKAKSTSGTSSLQSEIGGVTYGGSDAKDNSGKLQYVRIEYSGFRIDDKKECNALSLYTVGSGTTIDHIECFEGADDGIEFFGGSVNVSDVALINMEDDSIDWTEGFTGTVTNAYVQFKEATTATKGHAHDNGIEGDGYGAEVGNKSNPKFYSNPTIENLTIKGTGKDTLDKNGMRLRVGTKGQFKNILIKGVKIGVRIDKGSGEVEVCKSDSKDYDATACTTQNPTAANVINGDLHFDGVKFEGIDTELKNTTGNTGVTAAVLFENKGTATGAGDVSKWTWVTEGRIK